MTKNKIMHRAVFLFGLLIAISGTMARAQYEDGSLVGTIRDASGAVVGNAAVTVTNVNTGIVTKVATNGSGDYEVPSLHVGVYTIEAEASGFAPAEAKNISIAVGARQHIDLTLKVGQTATTVEVSDVALQIETTTSERGPDHLGLPDRGAAPGEPQLLRSAGARDRFAPGADGGNHQFDQQPGARGAYNVNGQRSMFNNFLLDGMDNNAYGESNQGFDNQIIAIAPDSVAEFNVVTNNESAEYGRSSGATVNVASAAEPIIPRTALRVPAQHRPQRGGILQADAGRQHRRQRSVSEARPSTATSSAWTSAGRSSRTSSSSSSTMRDFARRCSPLYVYTLPTQNEINGILVVPVKNPLTGDHLSGRDGDSFRRHQPAFGADPQLLQAVHQHIAVCGLSAQRASTPTTTPRKFPSPITPTKAIFAWTTSRRSSSWFLRISDRKETGVNYPVIPLPLDSTANGTIRILDQQVALGYTHLFGANKVLDARLGLSRTKAGKYTLSIGQNTFTIPGLQTVPAASRAACRRCRSPTSLPLDARARIRNGRIRRCWIPR